MPARIQKIIMTAGGLSKAKHLFLFLIFSFLFSSCVTIEKRKYMDGYHVEQNVFSKTDDKKGDFTFLKQKNEKPRHLIAYSKPVLISSSSLSVCNNEADNIIVIDKPNQLVEIVFSEDTLKKKKLKKKDDVSKFDEKKDATKKERQIPLLVKIGLLLGVFSFSCLFWILLGGITEGLLIAGFVSSLVGFIFSSIGWHQINNNYDKEGKELAIAGFILNLLFIISELIYLIWAILLFISFFGI